MNSLDIGDDTTYPKKKESVILITLINQLIVINSDGVGYGWNRQ